MTSPISAKEEKAYIPAPPTDSANALDRALPFEALAYIFSHLSNSGLQQAAWVSRSCFGASMIITRRRIAARVRALANFLASHLSEKRHLIIKQRLLGLEIGRRILNANNLSEFDSALTALCNKIARVIEDLEENICADIFKAYLKTESSFFGLLLKVVSNVPTRNNELLEALSRACIQENLVDKALRAAKKISNAFLRDYYLDTTSASFQQSGQTDRAVKFALALPDGQRDIRLYQICDQLIGQGDVANALKIATDHHNVLNELVQKGILSDDGK